MTNTDTSTVDSVTPAVHGSNPVIVKLFITYLLSTVNYKDENKEKMGPEGPIFLKNRQRKFQLFERKKL